MPSYDALKNKQRELIRKAVKGSAFLAPLSADPIAALTSTVAGAIELSPLPDDYDDLGWLSSDGAAFAREVSQSEVTSWGSATPTRTDITSDTSTLTVTMQETKLLTIGIATGADLAGIVPDPDTGEVRIDKPVTPEARSYRVLTVAVDRNPATGGEIYIARYMPSAKVSSYAEQSFSGGDDPIAWGVTFTGEVDDTLGSSESWFFGGQGWKDQLVQMGFPAPTP